jgi:hypothetical protein
MKKFSYKKIFTQSRLAEHNYFLKRCEVPPLRGRAIALATGGKAREGNNDEDLYV